MKYIIILFISFGLVLSLEIGVEYNCFGKEMFPKYYGNPFVFKRTSLGTSLEYFYSVFGIFANVLVWSIFLVLVRLIIIKIITVGSNKPFRTFYKIIVGVLVFFSTLNIVYAFTTIGSGFKKGQNYWYFDLDNEAREWGIKCEGNFIINSPNF
jgi:hypothetical protein